MSDQPQYPQYPSSDDEGGQGSPPPSSQPGQNPPAYGQPAPGGYPPPPAYGQPAPGGYPPPPGYGQPGGYPPAPGYGQMPPAQGYPGQMPPQAYASWWSRVGASLLDSLIAFGIFIIPLVVGFVIAFQDSQTDPITDEISGVEPLGVYIIVITGLAYVAFEIWNRGVRVGTKGQSLGKKVVGINIVKADTGQLLGGGSGFLRLLMTYVFGFVPCGSLIDVLWPLWDEKNQTLHDKVVGSIALRV